jgi:hypothetical protein
MPQHYSPPADTGCNSWWFFFLNIIDCFKVEKALTTMASREVFIAVETQPPFPFVCHLCGC